MFSLYKKKKVKVLCSGLLKVKICRDLGVLKLLIKAQYFININSIFDFQFDIQNIEIWCIPQEL